MVMHKQMAEQIIKKLLHVEQSVFCSKDLMYVLDKTPIKNGNNTREDQRKLHNLQ